MRLVFGLEDSARKAPVRLSPVGKRDIVIVRGNSDRLERDTDIVGGQGRVVVWRRVAVDDLHENESEHKRKRNEEKIRGALRRAFYRKPGDCGGVSVVASKFALARSASKGQSFCLTRFGPRPFKIFP